jgi:hypothetical protein
MALVEQVLSRGDRRYSEVLEDAYRAGAYLEAWSENFSLERWEQAHHAHGLDLHREVAREWTIAQALPWDHIDWGVSREFLHAEWLRSTDAVTTPDCREGACRQCGLQRYREEPCPILEEGDHD